MSTSRALTDADRTTMTRNVAVVEERGLVAVSRHQGDARRLAEITPKGREPLEAALETWGTVQASLTERMGVGPAENLRHLASPRPLRRVVTR